MSNSEVSRRDFLRVAGLAGTALCLGFYFPSSAEEAAIVNTSGTAAADFEMNPWIHININGKVTLFNHRAEMGQGSYQSVPQIIAEELEVDLKDIDVASPLRGTCGRSYKTAGSKGRGTQKNFRI